MRTTLILSTLFAVSLIGSSALADKPDHIKEFPRAHGDQVDKSYRDARAPVNVDRSASAKTSSSGTVQRAHDPSASRVNCSTDAADCSAHSAVATTKGTSASSSSASSKALLPSTKGTENQFGQRGDARYNCNEGDECSVSSKAAQTLWKTHGAVAAQKAVSTSDLTAPPGATSRLLSQRGDDKISCNEGDECTPSSKQAKQNWAYEAVKKGTFNGKTTDLDATGNNDKLVAAKMMRQLAERVAAMKASQKQ